MRPESVVAFRVRAYDYTRRKALPAILWTALLMEGSTNRWYVVRFVVGRVESNFDIRSEAERTRGT
jgi:hypothetical protein